MKLQPLDQLVAPEDRLKVVLSVGSGANAEARIAECGFGSDLEDESIATWDSAYSGLNVPRACDAAEFGALASMRWRYYRKQDAVVRNFNGLRKIICEQPNTEVAMLAVMRASWFTPDNILGVCHFRRTWANSLYVDFLAKHPLLEAGTGPVVGGVGLNLLAFVVRLAKAISARRVWGESSKDSADFYRRIFLTKRSSDEFRLDRRKYSDFLGRAFSKGAKLALDNVPKAVAEKNTVPNLSQR